MKHLNYLRNYLHVYQEQAKKVKLKIHTMCLPTRCTQIIRSMTSYTGPKSVTESYTLDMHSVKDKPNVTVIRFVLSTGDV